MAYDDPATQILRAEVPERAVWANNSAQKSGIEPAVEQRAVLDPTLEAVRAVSLLKTPSLSAIPAGILKPLAL